jgi:aspartate/methionine/tyrosine aminotransferase
MWNYVTYRDAIGILGMDADAIYPEGATRLDPAVWADLGWLTCFAGPPEAAVTAMREAVSAEALNQYTPDCIGPLRDAAAAALGGVRGDGLEVIGTAGAQEGIALSLMAVVDPGGEVLVGDPGYFHVPSAAIAAGGDVVPVPVDASSGFRMDPDAVAARVTPRTRALVLVDPVNPYGTAAPREELAALAALADRHGFLIVHDVTHGAIAVEEGAATPSLPALGLTDNAVATFSVSHCWGMAGARVGFLAGPPDLMRGCLQLKAALSRLNTNLVAQRAALAALGDAAYLPRAAAVVRRNLAHLRDTLAATDGLRLVVSPQRGIACAVDTSGAGVSAQELMVALFARRVAVYPGDGLGDSSAAHVVRVNLSRPDAWAMDHLRDVLPDALAEARSGRWREPVAALLERKGTERGRRVAAGIRGER